MKKPAILEEKYFMKFVNGASLGAPSWFIGIFNAFQSRILHSEMIFIFFDPLVLELFFSILYTSNMATICGQFRRTQCQTFLGRPWTKKGISGGIVIVFLPPNQYVTKKSFFFCKEFFFDISKFQTQDIGQCLVPSLST